MAMPEMQLVRSTSIAAVGFDPIGGVLFVRFRGTGETYAYSGVDTRVYDDLLAAQSKGNYFNASIRDRYSASKCLTR